MKNVAFLVQNLSQFYSMKNGIDALISKGHTVDIFVPRADDWEGFRNIFNDTAESLAGMGYSVRREVDRDEIYKILLEPYPMWDFSLIPHDYRIKYRYSPVCAKPDPVFRVETNIIYDAQLTYSRYEASFLSAYSVIEPVGMLKYVSYEKRERPQTDKKILLYLPTYGDISSLDSVADAMSELKDEFYIITKFHHGTSFLFAEEERVNKLASVSDERYDQKTEISSLLSVADAVLSDNSGAIFESVYAEVPVAVFTDALNDRRLGGLDTPQYKLVNKGILPHAKNASEIRNALKTALSDEVVSKQRKLKQELFYLPEDPVGDFVATVEKYLNDDIDLDRKAIHDLIVEDREHLSAELKKTNDALAERDIKIAELTSALAEKDGVIAENTTVIAGQNEKLEQKERALGYYENGKLYRMAKKIYSLRFRLKPGKKT